MRAGEVPGAAATHRPDLSEAVASLGASVRRGALPCALLGVADRTGIVGLEALSGPRDRVSSDSIVFLASVSKPIVATAVMQYVDEGRLDLDAPIARYLPAFIGAGRERVTVRHILTHTSGLPDTPIDELVRRRPSYARALAQVMTTAPRGEPGREVRYASAPWILLAEVMARLSGASFPEALRRRLTGPLGMTDTTFDPRHARARLARLHGVGIPNRLVGEVLLRFMARATLPGGGMFGTLPDLLRLGRALLPGRPAPAGEAIGSRGARVLTQRAIDEMTRLQTAGLTQVLPDGSTREARFALGWAKPAPGMPGTGSVFTHGGAAGGRLWVDPEVGLVFAFLTNLWGAPDEPALRALDEVYRAWPVMPAPPLGQAVA